MVRRKWWRGEKFSMLVICSTRTLCLLFQGQKTGDLFLVPPHRTRPSCKAEVYRQAKLFCPRMTNSMQPEVVIDEATVTRLKEMGFTRDRCRQAVYNTGNNGVEDPMAWVIDHMADPDFSDPVVDGGGSDPGHNQQSPAPSPKLRLENQ